MVIPSENIQREPSKRLTNLYIVALSCIAILTLFGQTLVQQTINNQKFDGKIINLAGRQRFQSQSIVKIILILSDTSLKISPAQKEFYFTKLDLLLNNWSHHHIGLRDGNLPELNYRVINSPRVDSLFKIITPHYNQVYDNARSIQDAVAYYKPSEVPGVTHSHKDSLLAHEYLFLDIMDKIVNQFNVEAEKRIEEVKKVEVIVLIMTLMVLLLEGLFIFRPSANHIKSSFLQLVNAEYKSRQLIEELSEANVSLKRVQEDLRQSEREKYEAQLNERKLKSASIIQGQEDERKRIAADLHDGMGQLLTLLKLKFEQINIDHLDPKEALAYEEVNGLIKATIQEIRNISFNLMPAVLGDFGILPALKLLCQQAANTSKIEVTFENINVDNQRFDKNMEVGIYRIAQEAINNAIKYSKSAVIQVTLEKKEANLYLVVLDQGVGFIKKRRSSNKKYHDRQNGISNMEERAELLNGRLNIISKLGKGTVVTGIIPVFQ